jgi:hypothetical protein
MPKFQLADLQTELRHDLTLGAVMSASFMCVCLLDAYASYTGMNTSLAAAEFGIEGIAEIDGFTSGHRSKEMMRYYANIHWRDYKGVQRDYRCLELSEQLWRSLQKREASARTEAIRYIPDFVKHPTPPLILGDAEWILHSGRTWAGLCTFLASIAALIFAGLCKGLSNRTYMNPTADQIALAEARAALAP